MVSEGLFREDLYYRLDVIPIHLPPLRERPEDIPLLVNHFLKELGKANGKVVKGCTPEAIDMLKTHEWKGNIRELENVLERMVTLGNTNTEIFEVEDLKIHLNRSFLSKEMFLNDLPEEGLNLEDLIEHIEKGLLLKALDRTHWMKKDAAKLLHLNFRSFRYRLSKYGIIKNGLEDFVEMDDLEETADKIPS